MAEDAVLVIIAFIEFFMQAHTSVKDVKDVIKDYDVQVDYLEHVKIDTI